MAARLLAVLLIATALVAGGYTWGDHARDIAWKAKEAQRLQNERIAQDSELRRADKAAGETQAKLLSQQIAYDQLEEAFNAYKRQHQILARAPAARLAGAPAVTPAAPQLEPTPDRGDPALSLGAVWMWNSALAGQDAPAGSCGLADASEEACAADSGVTLTQAWDNQALNARLCAEDRVRHQQLIDYLREGKKWTSNSN